MHSKPLLLIFAVVATLAVAAPLTPSKPLAKHFKVPIRPRPKLSPAKAMFQAYRKYGWEIIIFNPEWEAGFGPPSSAAPVPSSTAPPRGGSSQPPFQSPNSTRTPSPGPTGSPTNGAEEGEVTATPEENESEYLSPVNIGGQPLNLNLDTGSSDLWVFSSRTPASERAGHSFYDPSKSSTWSSYPGASWEIQYGDGSTASGSVGFDTVDIGGATVEKQCVELAESLSRSFLSDPASDGLLGLGFSSINTVRPQKQKTFFENVMGDLDEPVFTADLAETTPSTYEFGSIDTSKYTGEMHYTPIDNTDGYWAFNSPTYTVGGSRKQCQLCNPAIADTGTSLIIADDDVAEAYYAQVPGAQLSTRVGGYVFACHTALPDFGVAIGEGYTAVIKGADMVYAPLTPGSSTCFGGVQPNGASTNSGPPIQIFGDVLLKHFFVVFDGGNTRLGIAEKA